LRIREVIWITSVLAALVSLSAARQNSTPFEEDFQFAWRQIGSTYAYFDVKKTQWSNIPKLYAQDIAAVKDKREFVQMMERVVDELYDPHAQLTVNTATSPRLVPSGTDLWAEWRGTQAVITDVRAGSDAERAGIRPAVAVVAVNQVPIDRAVVDRMGRSYPHSVPAARDWALRAVLAGTHNVARDLQLVDRGRKLEVTLPARDQYPTANQLPVTSTLLQSGIGYIRINDALGDNETVAAFDASLARFRDAPGLIVDLRQTPSGGNTSVARGILGRFVEREMPYQKHVLPSEERETGIRRSWLELVSPRGPFIFTTRVAVLVGHWTGSMGEGLAIGFDATGRGIVVGTSMAALLGATYHITMPNTGIGINVPAERLYHVNGTPREAFQPRVAVDIASGKPGEDIVLATALRALLH
jgi:C-terminal processing protease CtpA/Prc